MDKREPFKKVAWVPTVAIGDGTVSDSKFSGTAFIPKDESWPTCSNCQKPMQLFVQLNATQLPQAFKARLGDGILQLFYCTNWDDDCETECESFFPFSTGSLVRIVGNGIEAQSLEASPVVDSFPAQRIVSWNEVEDLPSGQEFELLTATELTEEESELYWDSGTPLVGEKLGGWPYWVQNIEYPNCPICEKQMGLLFQIDSEQNVPFSFGDSGCGHITQCPEHKHSLAFGWACS